MLSFFPSPESGLHLSGDPLDILVLVLGGNKLAQSLGFVVSALKYPILSINQWVHSIIAALECTDTSNPLGGCMCLFIQPSLMERSELLKPEISCPYSEKWSHFLIQMLPDIYPESPHGKIAVVKYSGRIIKLYLY